MDSDEQVRACLALMRLAPYLLADRKGAAPPKEEKPRGPIFDEDHWTPERRQALALLDYYADAPPEEIAAAEAREKAAYEAWLAKEHGPFKSAEEAMEHFRTYGVDNIGDLWDRIEAEEYALLQAKLEKGGEHE